MKTQNTKLVLEKRSLVELNDHQISRVIGGTMPIIDLLTDCFTITDRFNK